MTVKFMGDKTGIDFPEGAEDALLKAVVPVFRQYNFNQLQSMVLLCDAACRVAAAVNSNGGGLGAAPAGAVEEVLHDIVSQGVPQWRAILAKMMAEGRMEGAQGLAAEKPAGRA